MKDTPGPLRTCLGCRTRENQSRLRRLALIPGPKSHLVVWDENRTRGGRGAWLCDAKPACLEKALRKKVLARAFRLEGEVDASALTAAAGGGNAPAWKPLAF